MSNHNKPRFTMPGTTPPPLAPPPAPAPAATLPGDVAELLERFPLPWVVGPYGDIWVAADVETFDPEKIASTEKVAGLNGTFWRATCAKPRRIMENPTSPGIAALIVHAVNKLAVR